MATSRFGFLSPFAKFPISLSAPSGIEKRVPRRTLFLAVNPSNHSSFLIFCISRTDDIVEFTGCQYRLRRSASPRPGQSSDQPRGTHLVGRKKWRRKIDADENRRRKAETRQWSDFPQRRNSGRLSATGGS